MSQDHKVLPFLSLRNRNQLSNHDKIVYSFRSLEHDNNGEALELLSTIDPVYYQTQFHKDIARALLCWAISKTSNIPEFGKQSEFYLIVYRLTKHITENKINFNGSGHFYQLRDELFKELTSEWR